MRKSKKKYGIVKQIKRARPLRAFSVSTFRSSGSVRSNHWSEKSGGFPFLIRSSAFFLLCKCLMFPENVLSVGEQLEGTAKVASGTLCEHRSHHRSDGGFFLKSKHTDSFQS